MTTHPGEQRLLDALSAAGLRSTAAAWAAQPDRPDAPTPPEGRWTIVPYDGGFVVGAVGRAKFRTYATVDTEAAAIELVVRLAANPLRRVLPAVGDEDRARGALTAAGIRERRGGPGEGPGPARVVPGDLLDCLRPETGHHLYAVGTTFSERSQPPSDVGAARFVFQVARPLPPGSQEGIAEPWFGQRGGGAMVVLDRPIRWYVDHGYLDPVGEPMAQGTIDFLDGLDALPPWAGVSFRGLPPGAFPEEGSTIVATGLTATSRDPRVATENFAVRGLWAINGRTGRAIERLSSVPGDREVVFRQGSFFKVLKVARHGDLAVVFLDDVAFWGSAVQPPAPTPLSDFARLVTARIDDAQREPVVPVNVPAKFVGPIS